MTASSLLFTPTMSATFWADTLSSMVSLPAPDAGSPATVIQNTGPEAIAILSRSLANDIFSARGAIVLQAGSARLLSDPAFATASIATVQSGPAQRGTIRFMRGTTAETWIFAAPGAEVF